MKMKRDHIDVTRPGSRQGHTYSKYKVPQYGDAYMY